MTERVRVYHPETDEPFDVPKAKADELRLNRGWRTHPLDPGAKPHVSEVEADEGPDEVLDDWRGPVQESAEEPVRKTPSRLLRRN